MFVRIICGENWERILYNSKFYGGKWIDTFKCPSFKTQMNFLLLTVDREIVLLLTSYGAYNGIFLKSSNMFNIKLLV